MPNLLSVFAAGLAYFALGGLWFTPLFGRHWDRAVGFQRPPKWRPPLAYYVGPLLGCLVVALAIALLLRLVAPASLSDSLAVGLIVGLGVSAAITGINAISPNVPRPGLYALVIGSYHAVGALLCAWILYGLS